ncbi:protein kinase domain-containing protein [Stenomitos frigidus]|uniref:Serine/threonine protein kinase n=1 Tax=Stenomitos frigidus ULC18 TaxID=2107698 RepID=A0A2T1DZP1_9CYAN|nr:protein kinase [Stenomitos frigidus]PSB25966.1 serine/threonine protein kinase [Stenomitos frigidus ULC18]
MSYCLNPYCRAPQNPDTAKFCSTCGFKLLLGDRYRALQPIGRGGFGRTFLAVDEYKPSQPSCVIKQFFPQNRSFYDPEHARALFRREAVQLEALGEHPQIPQLLAHFEQAEYQYLVQEFIDGPNLLQETARRGAFTEEQVWQLLNDLLPVIAFIHSHQVIHRDIKPQNIIRRAATQQFVLVDFGAAKTMTGSDVSQTGTSIGSPVFAAPEQAIGKAIFASDLYSLGVTCIYLLTQVPPADLFDTEEGNWQWQRYLKHPVSGALGKILNKMLQGAVKRRYQLAADVLRDLNSPVVMDALHLSTDGYRLPTQTAQPAHSAELARSPSPSTTSPVALETTAPVTQLSGLQAAASWVCTQTLTDHSSWVRSVVIHPDATSIASGSGDRTIKIWDLATGALLRTLSANAGWVRAIAVSADGQTLANCNNDRRLVLWHWETGERLQTLDGHSDWARAVCFSPDGHLLASGSQDKTIRLWQLPTGDVKQVLVGHTHWVIAVAFSPDGKMIASGSRDKTIRLWDTSAGTLVHLLEGHQDAVNAITISPDGRTLASASDDSTIRLWDLPTGKLKQVLSDHKGAVNALAIDPDGTTLVSGSQDTTIKLWSLATGVLLDSLAGHTNWVWSVAMSSLAQTDVNTTPGKVIVSGSWDATVKIWRQQV